MMAFSTRQPLAEFFFFKRDVWSSQLNFAYRGPILICSGTKFEKDWYEHLRPQLRKQAADYLRKRAIGRLGDPGLPLNAVLGVGILKDVTSFSKSLWSNAYGKHALITDIQRLSKPYFDVKTMRGLFPYSTHKMLPADEALCLVARRKFYKLMGVECDAHGDPVKGYSAYYADDC